MKGLKKALLELREKAWTYDQKDKIKAVLKLLETDFKDINEQREEKKDGNTWQLVVRSTLNSHEDDTLRNLFINNIKLGEDSIQVWKDGKKEYSFSWDYIQAISIIDENYIEK